MGLRATESSKLRGFFNGLDAIDAVDVATGVATRPDPPPAHTSSARWVLPLSLELAEVDEVLFTTRGTLHRAKVVQATDEDVGPSERDVNRIASEGRVHGILIDARNPLHDVKWSEARVQPEVCALRQLSRIQGIERELVGREIAHADVLSVDGFEQMGESFEVLGIWVRNDVEILGRAYEPVHAYRDASDDYEPNVCVDEREQQFIGLKHRAKRPAAARR